MVIRKVFAGTCKERHGAMRASRAAFQGGEIWSAVATQKKKKKKGH